MDNNLGAKRRWRENRRRERREDNYYLSRMESVSFAAVCVITSIVLCLIILIFASVSHAEEVNIKAAILYAESANDHKGWTAKLNTYNCARRKGETLEAAMKRVSSAYLTKSPQYRKAVKGKLNAYEAKVYAKITRVVKNFVPDRCWQYVHHENLSLYPSKQIAMNRLRKAWGPRVDYSNAKKIGHEHYFSKKREMD